MGNKRPGHQALAYLDQVLAEMPKKNDHALSHATTCLAEFRDGLVAQARERGINAEQRKQLTHINSVITIVLGIHFPLGQIPWPELGKAREWLAQAVAVDGGAR